MKQVPEHRMAANPRLKKWGQSLLRRLRIRTSPSIKVYHGFGTAGHMEVSGHVFRWSPQRQEKFSTRFWRNSLSLLRLFIVRPWPGAPVVLRWNGTEVRAVADDQGYFRLQWTPQEAVPTGWHEAEVRLDIPGTDVAGCGRIFIPQAGKYAVVSDIDDTFLVSHSSDLARRLYVLLTRNARTRKPFADVVAHYRLLERGEDGFSSRPFFYVSSSEWNLYDYIREFSDNYGLPDGIYLLSHIKQLHEFWKTGQGKHKTKYTRIARLLLTYPEKQFILLGDDSQEDPAIYRQLADDFPGRIICIYLRHVRKDRLEATRVHEAAIRAAGVEICYFTHSRTAIAHSARTGLIRKDGTPE